MMDFIKKLISPILFILISLFICYKINGFTNGLWLESIICSVIGGVIVEILSPSTAIIIKKILLKKEEKEKVKQNVKHAMRLNINRLHDATSASLATAKSLRNRDMKDKDFKDIYCSAKNAKEELDNLEKYLKQ